eukprot:1201615-Pyramimonas_sp.AAC.1
MPWNLHWQFVDASDVPKLDDPARSAARVPQRGNLRAPPRAASASAARVLASGAPNSKRRRKEEQPVDMWEPEDYEQFVEDGSRLTFGPEEDSRPPSMLNLTTALTKRFLTEVANWNYVPDTVSHQSFLVIALHATMDIEWGPNSDLIAARLIGTLMSGTKCAHPVA